MSIDLIPLQAAYIRQSKDVEDNTWIVFTNLNKEIGKLPNTLDPKQAMSYLHFGRKFELDALNIGIEFGRKIELEKAEVIFQDLKQQNLFLQQQNEMLSNKLEKFIIGEED